MTSIEAGRERHRHARPGGRWRALVVAGASIAATLGWQSGAAAQNLEQYDYENLRFTAVGVDILYADASQSEGTVGIGARVDLGFLGPYIRVVPRFAYWSADVDEDAVGTLERQIEEVSELPPGSLSLGTIKRDYYVLATDLQWTPPMAVAPYLGLGVDIYVLDDSGEAISGTFLDDAVITAGLSAVAGLQIDFARHWRVYGDVRGTLVTDASNVAVYGGLAYRFGP